MVSHGIKREDIQKYLQGEYYRGFELFGAHLITIDGKSAVRFSVYAPNALSLRLVGDFNQWNPEATYMTNVDYTGVYVAIIEDAGEGSLYKYVVETKNKGLQWKNDPYGTMIEQKPQGASIVCDLENFHWQDQPFMQTRAQLQAFDQPMSIYELNLSSWRRKDEKYYSYREIAEELIPYIQDLGYTHVEMMPITEHPYDGSWGYQQIGYYAITSRFGTPKDFMALIDAFHQAGIGVFVDWVPVHYPKDGHGLAYFDGYALYESDFYHDAYNIQWDTLNFDYGRRHVCNFMISNALFLAEYFHIDGLRVDAVADLLYKGFHASGQKEHFPEGIAFVKELNQAMQQHPDVLMLAEESSAFYGVTKPIEEGGLGFDFKWNMGWMNDTLTYFSMDPYFRQFHHDKLTFPMVYAFSEKSILPLSHDEVVHGKKSLIEKMPGDYEDKFAQLRCLYLYQYSQPGKKLLFMGGEFAQFIEWNEWQALDWHLLDYPAHEAMQVFIKTLNTVYRNEPALYEIEDSWDGFGWLSVDNANENIITYRRIDKAGKEIILAFNFSPEDRYGYQTPAQGNEYEVVINTDDKQFYGKGRGSQGNLGKFDGVLLLDLPGFCALMLKEAR